MVILKKCLFGPLPIAPFFSHDGLEGRDVGRFSHGLEAWDLLHRLLLDADGSPVCPGCHESYMDRCHQFFCPRGEIDSQKLLAKPRLRGRIYYLVLRGGFWFLDRTRFAGRGEIGKVQ